MDLTVKTILNSPDHLLENRGFAKDGVCGLEGPGLSYWRLRAEVFSYVALLY